MDVPRWVPCNRLVQLDMPYLLAGAIMAIFGGIIGTEYDGVFGPAPLAWLLGVVLNFAAFVTAFIKLCIMLGCCCQHWNPSHRSAAGRRSQLDDDEAIIGRP